MTWDLFSSGTLVATSVPELNKSQVTVVDQKGNLLSDQQELSELTVAGRQFEYSRRVETLLTQRVHNILRPVVGSDRYKAEVSADVDFNAVESTTETFNPDQPALRSEQAVSEQRHSSLPPQGVPGALSNQPPAPGAAPEQLGLGGATAGAIPPGQPLLDANGQQIMDPATGAPMLAPYPADKREQATRNYELDRSISYTRQQQGRVRRLSIAVVVDDQQIVDPQAGTVTYQPWSAEDLARFTRLVQDAVGFDASRGDSVSVVNTPFVADRGDVIEEIPFYAQPWFWDVAKQIIGALFILALVFGVLRPLLNNVTGNKKGSGKDLVPLERDLQPLATELDDDQLSLSGSAQQIMLANPNDSFEAQLNAIKNLVAENPARVAEVVKEWINGDE